MKKKRSLRKMTNSDYEQWKKLVIHVIRENFSWIITLPENAGITLDDAVSEGNVALARAWTLYDKKKLTNGRTAQFMTYAYRAIYNRVMRLVVKYYRFRDELAHSIDLNSIIDPRYSDQVDEVEKCDWVRHCINILKNKIGAKNTKILLMWADGRPMHEIGDKLGMTSEGARAIVNELQIRAVSALYELEDQLDG